MIERQMTLKGCGPAVLSRLLSLFGRIVSQWEIIQEYPTGNNGWSIEQLIEAANYWGIKLTPEKIVYQKDKIFLTPTILL